MAQSDILILLDCCWSGVANDTEGNGITELICACPFNGRANGVGHYSFTQALITELRFLSRAPRFSVGKLYTAIYTRMQSFLSQGIENESYPPPVHFVLSQEGPLIRGIQLSVLDPNLSDRSTMDSPKKVPTAGGGNRKRLREDETLDSPNKKGNPTETSGCVVDCQQDTDSGEQNICEQKPRVDLQGFPSESAENSDSGKQLGAETPRSILKDSLYPLDGPKALFAVRFREDIRGEVLSKDLLLDWLRLFPAAAEEVCIEASFKCFSTLVLISIPSSMSAYMIQHPAVLPLGAVLLSIILTPWKVGNCTRAKGRLHCISLLCHGESLARRIIASPPRSFKVTIV